MDNLDNFLVISADPRGSQQQLLTRINAHVARHSHKRRRREWAKVQEQPKDIPIKPWPATPKLTLVAKDRTLAHESSSHLDNASNRKHKRLATNRDSPSSSSDSEQSVPDHISITAVRTPPLPVNTINHGTLDPFMRLPVELSDRDKGLLQFFLTSGRRMMLRTCANPRYDTLLELAHKTMYRSIIHLYTHLILAETMMCRFTRREADASVEQKRRIVYQELYNLLLDEHVPVAEKIFRQSQVVVMDFTMGRRISASKHANNIDRMIRAHGGITRICAVAGPNADVSSEPRYPLTIYINSEIHVSEVNQLYEVLTPFTRSLLRLTEWVRKLQRHDFKSETGRQVTLCPKSRAHNSDRLRPLCTYFYRLIDDQLLSTNPSFKTAGAPFACAYAICIACLEYEYSAWQTLQYLLKAQEMMMASSDFDADKPDNMRLDPMIAWHILWVCRKDLTQSLDVSTDFAAAQANEARICQASSDAQKIFVYMARPLRSKMTRMLCRIALMVTEEVGADALFDETFLGILSSSVLKEWCGKHCPREKRNESWQQIVL